VFYSFVSHSPRLLNKNNKSVLSAWRMRRLRLIVNLTCNAFHFVKLKSVNGLAFTNNRKSNIDNGRNRHYYFSWAFHLTSYCMVAHRSFDAVSTTKTILHRKLREEDLIVRILNLKNLSVFWPPSVGKKENHRKSRSINEPAGCS